MTRRSTALRLLGLGALALGGLRARLTFGAIPPRLTLIFDGSCDFCTRTVRLVRAVDRNDRITVVPFQKPGEPERHGLTVSQCEGSVWAKISATPATLPIEIHILAPSITHSSPSRRARVRWLAASEPVSGSVSPKQPSSSPEHSRGR